MINPEANQTWFGPDGEIKYGTAIEKAQFDATVGIKGSEKAKSGADKNKDGKVDSGEESGSADERESKQGEAGAEKSEDERLQATLKAAYDKGVPAVVVFGSQSAKDTEKLLGTLEQNMKNGKADFIYADTDSLDPNSELGQVARRNEESGHGLGADGKADLAFTGVYKVELGADGKYHIGNSVATFWGGRPEIAGIMNDQFRYANRDVSGDQGTDNVRPAPRADLPAGGEGGASGSERSGSEVQPPQTEEEKKAAEQRAKEAAEAERVKQFSEKPYSMDQYKEGWGRCLDRAGMESGPMRDAVDKLGQQILSGKVDGQEIAGLINQLQGLERGSAAQMLAGVNQELKENGVSIGATVKDGKIESMEMRADNGNVLVRVDQNGNVTATNKLSAQENIDQITLRLAKKIEPDACP